MGDSNEIVIDMRDESASSTVISPPAFTLNLLHSPVFVFILLLLSLSLLSWAINLFLDTTLILFKWFSFLLLVFVTRLFAPWLLMALVFFIERKYVRKTKTLYFVFALRAGLLYFFWSSSVLVSWILLMNPYLRKPNCLYRFTTITLSTCVVATCMWILKVVVLKHLGCQFRDKDFFVKTQELIDQEYLLQTIIVGTSAARLYTICDALRQPFDDQQLVDLLFSRVVNKLTDSEPRDIQATDLLKFMKKPDAENVLQLFKSDETRIISQTSLRNWMVKVCMERRSLVDLLNDKSMAIKDLDYIVCMNLLLWLAVVWFSLMGFAAKFRLSILAPAGLGICFIGSTSKYISEGIIFVFKMRWYDIGDYCIVDNQKLNPAAFHNLEMVVRDIGIFTTIFENENSDTESFSNSGLAIKSIKNLTRSSVITETLEIYVTAKTSSQNIKDFELKLDEFIKSKPENWSSEHSLLVKEVAEKGPKYALRMTHATKFENYEVNNRQRSELFLELKKILEELGIEYLSVQ